MYQETPLLAAFFIPNLFRAAKIFSSRLFASFSIPNLFSAAKIFSSRTKFYFIICPFSTTFLVCFLFSLILFYFLRLFPSFFSPFSPLLKNNVLLYKTYRSVTKAYACFIFIHKINIPPGGCNVYRSYELYFLH